MELSAVEYRFAVHIESVLVHFGKELVGLVAMREEKSEDDFLPPGVTMPYFIPEKVLQAHLSEGAFKALYGNWESGNFQEAFPALASIPPELNYIPLAQARARIESLQPKSEDIVEVVGLKIPTVELAQWGALIIIGVQFYLWIHLHEFNRRIGSRAPGRDVAWEAGG